MNCADILALETRILLAEDHVPQWGDVNKWLRDRYYTNVESVGTIETTAQRLRREAFGIVVISDSLISPAEVKQFLEQRQGDDGLRRTPAIALAQRFQSLESNARAYMSYGVRVLRSPFGAEELLQKMADAMKVSSGTGAAPQIINFGPASVESSVLFPEAQRAQGVVGRGQAVPRNARGD